MGNDRLRHPDEVVRRAAALGAPEERSVVFPLNRCPYMSVTGTCTHTRMTIWDSGFNPDMTFDAAMQAVSLGGGVL